MVSREEHSKAEIPGEAGLAPYAASSATSRGRRYPEPEHPYRSMYQRDRDRIIHSVAFRRLEYKTQVFVNREGDHFRTRLTHTLEVAQISRSIARALRLNEDLTEAIALAHDLGHTPYGHSGEEELNRLMEGRGGFDHNSQGLRVVDLLERRYRNFPGLNLSYEVREAFVRHHPPYDAPATVAEFDPHEGAPLETQITVLADEIAYDNHDIDDGLSSGILSEEEVASLPIWQHAIREAPPGHEDLDPELRRAEGVRRLINLLVTDAITTTQKRIQEMGIGSFAEVRACRMPIVTLSPDVAEMKRELEAFLLRRFYQHHRVTRMAKKAQRFLREMFLAYIEDPALLPPAHRRRTEREDLYRVVADYIAGMTDRFAEQEYRMLFHPFEKT